MAYPTELTAALTGATPAQLQYWRSSPRGQEPLLVPTSRRGKQWLYSFRDVIALRTFAYLRESISLQRIRRAAQTLGDLGDEDHLSAYRLVAIDDGSIVWIAGPDQYVELVRQPGQSREPVVMEQVFGPFLDKDGKGVLPLFHPVPNIAIDCKVLAGYPVIRGTRVPYDLVSSLVNDGVPPAEIADFYPSVTPEGAEDAVRFARYVEERTKRRAA